MIGSVRRSPPRRAPRGSRRRARPSCRRARPGRRRRARATRASAASSSSVGSLSTSPSSQHAAVAVVGVLAQADVGDEEQARRRAPDGLERARHDAVGVDGAACRRASFDSGMPNSSTAGTPSVGEPPALLGGAIDRQLGDARHARHRSLDAAARHHEQRLDELRRRHARLAHQPAERFAPPQPPRAVGGEATHRPPGLTRSRAALQKCSTSAAAQRRRRVVGGTDRRPTCPSSRAVVGRHRPDAGDDRAAAAPGPPSGADQLDEVPHRRAAGEGDGVDAPAVERRAQPGDVGIGRRHGPIGDHLVDRRAARARACPAGSAAPRRRAAAGCAGRAGPRAASASSSPSARYSSRHDGRPQEVPAQLGRGLGADGREPHAGELAHVARQLPRSRRRRCAPRSSS